MEELIGGIILSALSAAAFIAYKHPKAYNEYFYQWKTFLFMAIAAMIWDFGIARSFEFFSPFFAPEKAAAAMNAAETAKVIDNNIVIVVSGLFAYLTALRLLPFMLKDDKPIEKKSNKEGN